MERSEKIWRKILVSLIILGGIILISIFGFLKLHETKILKVEDIDSEFIENRLGLMRDWFLANSQTGETLPYLYFPDLDEYEDGNNIIRQLLTTQGVFVLAKYFNDPELFAVGENNLATIFNKYYKFEEETGFGFFQGSNGSVKLGGAALGIITILEGNLEKKYSNELTALAYFVEAMQQSDGSFQTFYRPENFQSNDRFYSGEALLAAMRMYKFSGESKWLDYVDKSFGFYREKIQSNFLPQYVPWHTIAYAEIFEVTSEKKYADFIFWMNDKLIGEMLETNSSNPHTLGRFYNEAKSGVYGPPHSSSTSVYVEGISYALTVAQEVGDKELIEKYSQAIILGIRSLLDLQFTVQNSKEFIYPKKIIGAVRRTVDRNEIRIDQIGHTANALARALQIVFKVQAHFVLSQTNHQILAGDYFES